MENEDRMSENNGLESLKVLQKAYEKAGFKAVSELISDNGYVGRIEIYNRRYSGVWPFRKELPSYLIALLKIDRCGDKRERWEFKSNENRREKLLGIIMKYNQKFKASVKFSKMH